MYVSAGGVFRTPTVCLLPCTRAGAGTFTLPVNLNVCAGTGRGQVTQARRRNPVSGRGQPTSVVVRLQPRCEAHILRVRSGDIDMASRV